MVLEGKAQDEFVMLVSSRLKEVRESIPQIDTADEARGFAIGSLGTLSYMSKRLLSPEMSKKMDDAIEEQEILLAKMIEKLK